MFRSWKWGDTANQTPILLFSPLQRRGGCGSLCQRWGKKGKEGRRGEMAGMGWGGFAELFRPARGESGEEIHFLGPKSQKILFFLLN